MWKEKTIDLGDVKAQEPINVQFQYLGDGEYSSSSTSCGCTVADWDKETKTLKSVFTPNAIAKHLKDAGQTQYNSVKYIYVVMIEGQSVNKYDLMIKALVHEKH